MLPSVQNIIGSILAKSISFSSWTRMAYCRMKGLSTLDSWQAFGVYYICLANSFKGLSSWINHVNKIFFSPCSLSSCFLIHMSLHSTQPQGSSSLYNALRKEGIIMNSRNCVVRREKVVCELFRIIEMSDHKFSSLQNLFHVSPAITFISSFQGISSTLPGKEIIVYRKWRCEVA